MTPVTRKPGGARHGYGSIFSAGPPGGHHDIVTRTTRTVRSCASSRAPRGPTGARAARPAPPGGGPVCSNGAVTGDDPQGLRELAVELGTEAAAVAVRMRAGAVHDVRTKSSGTDVVTAADTAVEELLRARIAERRPGDAVLGEEGGGDPRGAPGQVCWVLDPIDGTVNYRSGLPWYAVSVGVTRDGAGLAGAVVEPASGRVWSAAAGAGATLDGAPLRASAADRLDLALVGTGFGYRRELRARQGELAARLLPRVGDLRRYGSAALDLCAVAAGWLDGYYEHGIHPWDWAAGAVIATEAGAVVRPPAAGDGPTPLFTVAAPGIAADLDGALADCGAGAI
jgi:myo-inositol-1(or 4)-monophosphatase